MDPVDLGYSAGLIVAGLLSLGVAGLTWTKIKVPGAVAFFLGNIGAACYSFGSLAEIHSLTPEGLLGALIVQYLGIATIGPFWLSLTWSVSGTLTRANRPQQLILFVVPFLVILAVATNPLHNLFYSSIQVAKEGPFTIPILGKGLFYWVNFIWMNLCLAVGTLILVNYHKGGSPQQKKTAKVMLLAATFPWVGMIVYQLGLSPYGLDTAPHGLAISGLLFAVALFRYRLFELPSLVMGQVLENMGEGVLVFDAKDRLFGFNPAMAGIHKFFNLSRIGMDAHSASLQVPELAPIFSLDPVRTLELIGPVTHQRRVYQVDRSPLLNRQGTASGRILLFTDITERIELTEKMGQLARTDELTGIANRRYFLERLREESDRSKRYGGTFSLAIFDLDHFKSVNDNYGHDVGDAVLKRTVRVLAGSLRTSDLLARYGGEEFALLVPGAGVEETSVLLERMRRALEFEEDPHGQDKRLMITTSIGLADYQNGEDVNSLIRRADQALYEAKNAGRNRLVVAKETK